MRLSPTPPETDTAPERVVRCPACRAACVYAPRNPYRPFCSAHCRGLDLGAWASEDYRIAAAPPTQADEEIG